MLYLLKLFGVLYKVSVLSYRFDAPLCFPTPLRKGGRKLHTIAFIILLNCILFFPGQAMQAQQLSDTINGKRLEEVQVTGIIKPSTSRSTTPLQFIQGDDFEKINALQVSDAVKFFSGVQVKDFGGIGGLKTVSIRSLGANYTSVAYDGITLSDYQTGQIDLGRFSLDNVKMISLSIGESNDIFQTARMQASAGALSITTLALNPTGSKKSELKASIKAGSFNLINLSVLYGQTLSQTFSMNASVDWLKTDGDYPFTQFYGFNKDSASVERRNNSDVETWKLEANLYGQLKNGGKLSFKTYFYDSDRGLPGTAIMYNSYAGERTKDINTFIQSNYTQPLSKKIDFQANAKFNFSNINYKDISNNYRDSTSENFYYQREYYLNATFLYKVTPTLSFSWANDGIYGNFSSNWKNCIFPSRTSWISSFSGKYEQDWLTLTGSILNHYIYDTSKKSPKPEGQNHLSPYIGFSIKPLDDFPFRVRGFYKNTFRLPTFGDKYYSSVQKINLKPENANQYDLGLTWLNKLNETFPYFSVAADVYWNKIDNKIVAFPSGSMFIWTVQNYGKVDIKGIDLNLKLHAHTGKFLWQINGTYTYQNVLDKTDPTKDMYNKQLPYTPHHSISGYVLLETPWINVNYNLLYSGKRYYDRVNRPENKMDAYIDQGVSLIKDFRWKEFGFTVSAECLNIMDEQYNVVQDYPMPGRSFRIGLKFAY